MRVQVFQMASQPGDVERNLARMDEMLHEAPPADLALFPELAVTGYNLGRAFWDLAETADGSPSLGRISEMARRHGRHIGVGFVERSVHTPGTLYDSLALISPGGDLLAVYRKIHLWQEEQQTFSRGRRLAVVEVQGVLVGLAICWDVAFPEVGRFLALGGAQVILLASAWDAPTIREWDIHVQARALENAVFVAASNRGGEESPLTYGGHSQILGPDGVPLAFARDTRDEVLTIEVDPEEVGRRRAQEAPYFRDRAPWAYRIPRVRSKRGENSRRD